MANPFRAFRAAEHAESIEGFLGLVVPDPLDQYFKDHFSEPALARRALFVYGQPGSGKTTIGRLFEPLALLTMLQNNSGSAFDAVRASMVRTGMITKNSAAVLGARVPLESDFRDISNLPYGENVRRQLLYRLIQSRTMLRWFSQLNSVDVPPERCELVIKEGSENSISLLGGKGGGPALERAKRLEGAIYAILGALVPPSEDDFGAELMLPYPLFESILEIRIDTDVANTHNLESRLKPLVILDDAHALGREQFESLRSWITRREIIIRRWVLSRMDVLSSSDIVSSFGGDKDSETIFGSSNQRDFDVVHLQGSGGGRGAGRRRFLKVAEAIGKKYLKQVDVFSQTQIADLASILETGVPTVPPRRLSNWIISTEQEAKDRGISKMAYQALEVAVDKLLQRKSGDTNDLRVALLRILVHRRTPVRQIDLFDPEETEFEGMEVDPSLIAGAEIHLFRTFGRPYYHGFDRLAYASSENPELFVRLSAELVDASLNRIVSRRRASLTTSEQHRCLRKRAAELFAEWNFPEASNARKLATGIAKLCEEATDRPNAYLNSGANAFGIPMEEYKSISKISPDLAAVLKYGLAYNVFSLSRDRRVKNRNWCLITLGGIACIHHGLTLSLGGFVEGRLKHLEDIVWER